MDYSVKRFARVTIVIKSRDALTKQVKVFVIYYVF